MLYDGDVWDEMYFFTKAQVEVLYGKLAQRLTILREGSYFGELAILKMLPGRPRSAC